MSLAVLLPTAGAVTGQFAVCQSHGSVFVCASDLVVGDPRCATGPGGARFTQAQVESPVASALASGGRACFDDGSSSTFRDAVAVRVVSRFASAGVTWEEVAVNGAEPACHVILDVGILQERVTESVACYVGPPDPGWGFLVPTMP